MNRIQRFFKTADKRGLIVTLLWALSPCFLLLRESVMAMLCWWVSWAVMLDIKRREFK